MALLRVEEGILTIVRDNEIVCKGVMMPDELAFDAVPMR